MSVDPIAVANLVNTIRVRVQDVKVHQHRCRNLILRCNHLISALSDSEDSTKAVPSDAHTNALNEAQAILEIVRDRVERWAKMDTVRSLLHQDDIREGVDELNRKVDTCIDTCQVRMTRELAQTQTEQIQVAQRDNSEIRDMILDLRASFTQYIRNPDLIPSGATFQAVVQDIQEETHDIQSATSLHNSIPEEISDSGSFLSQNDPFERAMRKFCRSLVNLELSRPTDIIVATRPPREKNRNLYKQSPKRTLSLRTLTGLGRRPSVSPSSQIPPLDFNEENTVWHMSQFFSAVPSSTLSDRSSLISSGTSIASGRSTLSGLSQHSMLQLERQRLERSSILSTLNAPEPLSPLKVALTTRESVWKTRGQNHHITKATMEGLIHYLLQKSADNDKEQHDTFFIGHPAFIAPLTVLAMLIRRFDDAFMFPEEVSIDIQARVMRLIRDWLKNEHVILADDLLAEMRKFIITVNNSDSLDELVLEVVQGIHEKASMNFRPSPITSSFNPATDRGPTPSQLANALATLEGEQYQHILPIEYMAHVGKLPQYHPNLSAAITLSKTIDNWVRSCILDLDFIRDPNGLKKRSEVKRFFVKTAKECHKMRNFASLGAIMGALQSKTIACLTSTHYFMPSAERQTYKTLAAFLRRDDGYRAYRQVLSKNEAKGYIPWHVVNLQDINDITQNEENVDQEHDPPLLNFELWAHLKDQAMSALRYRDVPFVYEEEGLEVAMEYLKKGLQGVSAQDDFNRVLQTNSDKLKANEAPQQRGVMAASQGGFGSPGSKQ